MYTPVPVTNEPRRREGEKRVRTGSVNGRRLAPKSLIIFIDAAAARKVCRGICILLLLLHLMEKPSRRRRRRNGKYRKILSRRRPCAGGTSRTRRIIKFHVSKCVLRRLARARYDGAVRCRINFVRVLRVSVYN